ncbi:hypothetical protein [Desulfolutivibrio sp.]|uniref:hypothetical protein n=1 Tax=Desulfolutivibrio sp. TaxID=2773296 RepID=UPI002F964098
MDIFGVLDAFAAAAGNGPNWRETWPFGPGYSEGFLSTILKFGLIAVFFLAIGLFLRFLFGPGGWMRDKEFDLPPPGDPASRASAGPPPAAPGPDPGTSCRTPDDPHA